MGKLISLAVAMLTSDTFGIGIVEYFQEILAAKNSRQIHDSGWSQFQCH